MFLYNYKLIICVCQFIFGEFMNVFLILDNNIDIIKLNFVLKLC